jgi:exonuclease III
MRIVHYNILEGCRGEPERLAGVLSWIAAQHADVAGLAELNGWHNPPVMQVHAAACGFPHSHLFVGRSQYLIGLMAKQPIEILQEIVDGVHHGIIHARIAGTHYLYSHFSPHERSMRIHEASLCAKLAQGVAEPLVMMGDLNSHSPLDRTLCEALATPENSAQAMDFEPQQILLDAGLIDVSTRNPPLWTINEVYHPKGFKRRVDHIYVNAEFKARHPRTHATVIHGPEVAHLSDHFPLICDTDD